MEPLKASSGPIGALTDDLFEQMYRLMEAHYAAVRRERFRADLVRRIGLFRSRTGKKRCGVFRLSNVTGHSTIG